MTTADPHATLDVVLRDAGRAAFAGTLGIPHDSGEDTDGELVSALSAAMATEVVAADLAATSATAIRRRRSRRRTWTALLAAGCIGVPATAYAGARFLAQTGQYGTGFGEEVDHSEFIDLCAPDGRDYIMALPTPTDPLPPGHTWREVAGTVADQVARGAARDCASGGVIEQSTEIRASMYFHAQSLWACEAVHREESGDVAAAADAAGQLAGTYDRLDEMGVLADGGWQPIRDRAAAGDLSVVHDFVAANVEGTRRVASRRPGDRHVDLLGGADRHPDRRRARPLAGHRPKTIAAGA